MELAGANVVVTGASQGIGHRIAERFAEEGATVIVIARSVAKLESLANAIGGHAIAADLSTADGVDGLFQRCLDLVGHVDVWVNNAGVETTDAFLHTDRDDIRMLARLNFEAPLMLTRDVAAHMVGRGRGHIVQMSSVAGAIPFPGLTAYAGSKAGLTNFTESLRVELAGSGVGLTVVAPGPVDTEMWDRLDTSESYQAPALKRFRQLLFLPKLKVDKIADKTVDAVRSGKAHVRLPKRYGAFHVLNNAPRRLAATSLAGVKLPKLQVPAPTPAAPAGWEPIWPTDNPVSRDWPLYTRGNVGEVFPEVVLPLTWTLFGQAAEDGWRRAYREMGLLMDGDVAADEPMVILSVFGGYCYINASYVRVLGVRAPGGTVEAIDMQFFGESDAPAYQPKPGDKNLKSTAKLGRHVMRLLGTRQVAGLDDDYESARAYLDRYPGDDASDGELIAYLGDLSPLFEDLFARHIGNTFSLALLTGALADLLAKVDRMDDLVGILGGIGDVESAAPSAAMWELSREANATPAVAAAFDEGVGGLVERLRSLPAASAWVADFDGFLADFGSRGPNEWDIGSDPWALRPELALAAIDRMRGADLSHDPLQQAERLAGERTALNAEVRAGFKAPDRFQFDKALNAAVLYSQARERSKTTIIGAVHGARMAQAELARRIAQRGGPAERWKTCLLDIDQFVECVADPAPFASLIAARAEQHAELSSKIPPFIVDGEVPAVPTWTSRDDRAESVESGAVVQGIAGCPGVARGRARVVLDAGDPKGLGPGDVLVAPITDPSWTPLFLAAEAVVVDVGATMSHAVIVSRELGIPCVVSAVGATQRIPDGALLEVDGTTGRVTVLELPDG